MVLESKKTAEIRAITGLTSTQFADLIRTAQLIFDPAGGIMSRYVNINWQDFGISPAVEANLYALGQKYKYDMPDVPPAEIWEQLIPETRSWVIDNKNRMWEFEELLPALDED